MSSSMLCRLCVNSCCDFRPLYDDSGQGNELYGIALELFHPKIVDMERAKHLTVICSECFLHICDFHSFQTTVVVAQLKLFDDDDEKFSIGTEESEHSEDTSIGKFPIDTVDIKIEEEFIALGPEEMFEAEGLVQFGENTPNSGTSTMTHATGKWVDGLKDQDLDPIGWLVNVPKDGDKSKPRPELELTNVDLSTSQTAGYIPPIEDTKEAYDSCVGTQDYGSVDDCSIAEVDGNDLNDEDMDVDIMDINPDTDFSSDNEISLAQFAANSPSDTPDLGDVSQTADGVKKKKREELNGLLAKWLPTIKCVACLESYPHLSLLEDHFSQTHPKEKFYISCCSRKFLKVLPITEHLLLHNDPNAFKCNLCHTACKSGIALRKHMTQEHNEQCKFPCKLCDKRYTTEKDLLVHHTLAHSSGVFQADGQTVCTCLECGNTGYSVSSLRTHTYSMHNSKPPHECTICGKSFQKLFQLREHAAAHQKKHLYVCAYCPQIFRHMSGLTLHRKRLHPHESTKYFYKEIDDSTS